MDHYIKINDMVDIIRDDLRFRKVITIIKDHILNLITSRGLIPTREVLYILVANSTAIMLSFPRGKKEHEVTFFYIKIGFIAALMKKILTDIVLDTRSSSDGEKPLITLDHIRLAIIEFIITTQAAQTLAAYFVYYMLTIEILPELLGEIPYPHQCPAHS